MSAMEAIELVHQAGGLAVMAHPGLNRTDEIIPALVKSGLDGIECFHTKHTTRLVERYLEIADRHRLLVTGGSDCHGMSSQVTVLARAATQTTSSTQKVFGHECTRLGAFCFSSERESLTRSYFKPGL